MSPETPHIDLSPLEAAARDAAGSGHYPVQTLLATFVRDVLPTLGLDVDVDAVVGLVKTVVWDSIVVPFDVPYVPEILERRLEAIAWVHLEAGLRALLSTIKPDEDPADSPSD